MSHDHLHTNQRSIDEINQENLDAVNELIRKGDFYVKRNARDGRAEFYQPGWHVAGMHIGEDGFYRLDLVNDAGEAKPDVKLDTFLSWQPESQTEVSGDTIPRNELAGFIQPEQHEQGVEDEPVSDEEIGHAVLDVVGVDEPLNEEPSIDAVASEQVDKRQEEINQVKESVDRMLSNIDETMPRVKDQIKGLNHLLDAVMTQIHYGMSHDEHDRQAMGRYAAEVESINMTLNSMLSHLNTLKYKAEGLKYDAFEEGSEAAAARAKLIEACDTMAKFIYGAPVLDLMRQFSNAHDTDQAQPAAEALRRTGADGTMEHLAANQKELVSALTE